MGKCKLLLSLGIIFFCSDSCVDSDKKSEHSGLAAAREIAIDTNRIDTDFLAMLSSAGIIEASVEMGLDFDKYLKPLVERVNHNYRRYRWSLGHHPEGGIMISAMPPEEEVGWTPWERWFRDSDGILRRESWVLYPLRNPEEKGKANWYKLEENELFPRYLKEPASLEEYLRRARIYDAASEIGFDINEVLLNPLTEAGKLYYMHCRWVVIPHVLSQNTPVIYILPQMDKSDDWPWESWYSDGKVKLIHHVHFTRQNNMTTGSWKEFPGAPQRPPEIFGVVWYWYDDKDLKPAMTNF
jgi:hypothetical protein